jgi:hypothetical protein
VCYYLLRYFKSYTKEGGLKRMIKVQSYEDIHKGDIVVWKDGRHKTVRFFIPRCDAKDEGRGYFSVFLGGGTSHYQKDDLTSGLDEISIITPEELANIATAYSIELRTLEIHLGKIKKIVNEK